MGESPERYLFFADSVGFQQEFFSASSSKSSNWKSNTVVFLLEEVVPIVRKPYSKGVCSSRVESCDASGVRRVHVSCNGNFVRSHRSKISFTIFPFWEVYMILRAPWINRLVPTSASSFTRVTFPPHNRNFFGCVLSKWIKVGIRWLLQTKWI